MASWFPDAHRPASPSLALVCFHGAGAQRSDCVIAQHVAGASAALYTGQGSGPRRGRNALLEACRARGWALLAVQMPGREQRRDEGPVTSLQLLAAHVLHALPCRNVPHVLVGHSCGAWAAYELARLVRLRKGDVISPRGR